MNFREWLMTEGSNPGAKTGLYPLGYGGVGLYPAPWYLTRSADAIYYLSIDERIYKGSDDGKFDITHMKPISKDKMKAGQGGLWSISHLKGRPSHKAGSDMAAKAGDSGVWDITSLHK
jgi:hypothetical protein